MSEAPAKPKKRVSRPLPKPGDPWTEEEEKRLQSMIRHDIAQESMVAVAPPGTTPAVEKVARILARWHLKLVHPAWGDVKLAAFPDAWQHPNVLSCARECVRETLTIYIERARTRAGVTRARESGNGHD